MNFDNVMCTPLTVREKQILMELLVLAGGIGKIITARQLRDAKFSEFVFKICRKDVAYPDAQQSRELQNLRDKGYLKMSKGKYSVILPPE